VENSPEVVEGRELSNSLLYDATVALFEQQGFARARELGNNSSLIAKVGSPVTHVHRTPTPVKGQWAELIGP
jgi:hypothetical protein